MLPRESVAVGVTHIDVTQGAVQLLEDDGEDSHLQQWDWLRACGETLLLVWQLTACCKLGLPAVSLKKCRQDNGSQQVTAGGLLLKLSGCLPLVLCTAEQTGCQCLAPLCLIWQVTHQDCVDQHHDLGHHEQLLAACAGVDVVPVAIIGEQRRDGDELG